MPDWLLVSIIASIVLTAALNLILHLFPRTVQRAQERLFEAEQEAEARDDPPGPRLRIFFPWKVMLAASAGLTLLLNLIVWLARS